MNQESEQNGYLLRILSQFKDYYPIIAVYAVVVSLLTLATPISVQSLINSFSFGPYFQPIFLLSLLLLGLLVVLGFVRSLQFLLVEYMQRKIYAKVTATIARAYFIADENGKSEIDEKANRYFDVVLIHKSMAYLVTDGVAASLQTVIGLILISLYHPFFILFGLIILAALFFPIYFLSPKAMRTAVEESTGKYDVASHINQLAAHGSSKDQVNEKLRRSDHFINHFLNKRSKHFKILFTQNIIFVIQYAILNAGLLALGGYLVVSNQLSVGQLVAAEIVVNAILGHFLYAAKYLENFYDLYAASQKVSVFFEFTESSKKEKSQSGELLSPLLSKTTHHFNQRFSSVRSIYSPTNYKKFLRNFSLATVGIVFLLLITPWQQFSRGEGRVLAFNPNDRVQKITAPMSGVVDEWLVKDGQFVKKGEPIVKVADNDPNYLERLEVKRDAAVAKFEAAKEASDTGRLNFHRQQKLVEEGLSSPKEFEQAKIKYKQLRADEAAAAAELAKAEVDLSRQQQQVVSAPRDGQILRILSGSGRTLVSVGDPLVDFVPQSESHAVELFIDGNDLPLVHEGRKVRLQFEGWPAIQFSGWPSVAIGSFGGVVSVIDPSVSANGLFRILIQPDAEDSVSWPDQQYLRQGTRAIGVVLLEQVSLGYEIWRQINKFPKSMEEPPANAVNPQGQK